MFVHATLVSHEVAVDGEASLDRTVLHDALLHLFDGFENGGALGLGLCGTTENQTDKPLSHCDTGPEEAIWAKICLKTCPKYDLIPYCSTQLWV